MCCWGRKGKSRSARECASPPGPVSSPAAAARINPMSLRDRLVDPRSPTHRPRKAAYALPTLFTAGNIFLGFLSILRCFKGAMLAASGRSEEHTSELQSRSDLVCRLLLEKKKKEELYMILFKKRKHKNYKK